MPLTDDDAAELERLRAENQRLKAGPKPDGVQVEESDLTDVERYDRAFPPGSELRRIEDAKHAFPADEPPERPEGASNAFASS